MRYVVITLVLLNLAHLGWNLGWPLTEPEAGESRTLLNSGLTLVSEFDARNLQADAEAERLCSLVSGFEDEAEAADFMAEAIRRGLDAAYAAGQSGRDRQYRVFLPPTPSAEIARLTLEDLAARLEAADVTADIGLSVAVTVKMPSHSAVLIRLQLRYRCGIESQRLVTALK